MGMRSFAGFALWSTFASCAKYVACAHTKAEEVHVAPRSSKASFMYDETTDGTLSAGTARWEPGLSALLSRRPLPTRTHPPPVPPPLLSW